MRKSLLVKIVFTSLATIFTCFALYDVFNFSIRAGTLPSHPCATIPVLSSIQDSIKLLKEQSCDLAFEFKTSNNYITVQQDRIKQLQLSYLIYHNQQVFSKSPYSTIRRYTILDSVKSGDLDGEYVNVDSSINIQESAGLDSTVHEVNHSLVRQANADSLYNPWTTKHKEIKFFENMLGYDYLAIINKSMSSVDALEAFGSSIPVDYISNKTVMLAAAEANAYLAEQYFLPPDSQTSRVQKNLQSMESFTDQIIVKGYHSNPEIKSILANPVLRVFNSTSLQDVIELESLIARMNALSKPVTETNLIHKVALITLLMYCATKLFIVYVLILFRIKYGRNSVVKNNKPFTIY